MTNKLREQIATINDWLRQSGGQELWTVLTCLRGPDFPSEIPNMDPSEKDQAYRGRRARKHKTVEIIRGTTFPGVGAARYRTDTKTINLPPTDMWDHFDRHVAEAARVLGLTVKIEEKKNLNYKFKV